MRKSRPWERFDLQDIAQELNELKGASANLLDLLGLLDSVEIAAHVMDAATLWRYHVVEAGEVAREQGLGGAAIGVEAVICHRLSATGLVARVDDLMTEALQKFEVAIPTSGKKASTKQGMNKPMRTRPP